MEFLSDSSSSSSSSTSCSFHFLFPANEIGWNTENKRDQTRKRLSFSLSTISCWTDQPRNKWKKKDNKIIIKKKRKNKRKALSGWSRCRQRRQTNSIKSQFEIKMEKMCFCLLWSPSIVHRCHIPIKTQFHFSIQLSIKVKTKKNKAKTPS